MLDIKFLRENPEIVKQNIKNKFYALNRTLFASSVLFYPSFVLLRLFRFFLISGILLPE